MNAIKYNSSVEDSEDTSCRNTESTDVTYYAHTNIEEAFSKTICVIKQPQDESALRLWSCPTKNPW